MEGGLRGKALEAREALKGVFGDGGPRRRPRPVYSAPPFDSSRPSLEETAVSILGKVPSGVRLST